MINPEALIYSSFSTIVIVVSSSILYTNIRKYRVQHLNLVAMGLLMQAMLPLSFIPQALISDPSYADILTVLTILGAQLFMLGSLLAVWNLQIHQSNFIPTRFYAIILSVGFVMAGIVADTRVVFDGTEWIIHRSDLSRLMIFIPTAWMLIEQFRLFYKGVKVTDSVWGRLALGYPLGMFGSLFFLAFRENLPFANTFYQVWSGVGAVALSVSLMKQPDVLILPVVRVSTVLLVESKSGLAITQYPDLETHDAHLTSAALSGILELVREISGRDDLPPKLGYVDYTIKVHPNEVNTIYCITNGDHPLLDGILNLVSNRWNHTVKQEDGVITSESIEEFQADIDRSLGIFL